MKHIAAIILIAFLAALSIGTGTPARADSEAPPSDYTKVTENGRYIFVMLAPDRLDVLGGPTRPQSSFGKSEIQKTYKQSGLYNNDGSNEPLWTVSWYSFSVYPSSDGKHVVKMGPWAQSTSDLAIAFYENGKELKRYIISDLVKNQLKLKHTVSHFFWKTGLQYNDKEGTVFIETIDGLAYTFSVKTGDIIGKKP